MEPNTVELNDTIEISYITFYTRVIAYLHKEGYINYNGEQFQTFGTFCSKALGKFNTRSAQDKFEFQCGETKISYSFLRSFLTESDPQRRLVQIYNTVLMLSNRANNNDDSDSSDCSDNSDDSSDSYISNNSNSKYNDEHFDHVMQNIYSLSNYTEKLSTFSANQRFKIISELSDTISKFSQTD